jgi:hypothetical protein
VRVEKRLDGTLMVRHCGKYLRLQECAVAEKSKAACVDKKTKPRRTQKGRGNDWNKDFDLRQAPETWQAAQASGCRCPEVTE